MRCINIVSTEIQQGGVVTHGTIEVRLLQYFTALHAKYGLPIISVILYPFETTVSESPYEIMSENGTGVTFKYLVLCLWQMEAQPIVDEHAIYLYTLLPAMKGVNATMLKQALKEMQRYYTQHQFGHHLIRFHRIMERSSTLTRQDKREIEEELHMYYKYDYFLDDNPDVIKRVNKGRKEGIAEGVQSSIMQLISKHFPALEQLAQP